MVFHLKLEFLRFVENKNVHTLLLKGLSLFIGQCIVFVADIFFDSHMAFQYYSFMNSMVFFAVLSSGTFPQKFAQQFQQDRNTSLEIWSNITVSWNIILIVIVGIVGFVNGTIDTFFQIICGFSLSLCALYSENQRINNHVLSSIVFPELTRSILLLLAFILVSFWNIQIQLSITLVYFLIGLLVLNRLPIIKRYKFRIETPEWRILFFGILNYLLLNDVGVLRNFYTLSDSLSFVRFQKFMTLQMLIVEMWYLSSSFRFISRETMSISGKDSMYLKFISIIIALILAVANTLFFKGSLTSSVYYFFVAVFTAMMTISFPGKIYSQLFGQSNKHIFVLVFSTLIFWMILYLKLKWLLAFTLWSIILVFSNILLYRSNS